MEGGTLVPKLPPWSYKSKLLTPKPKACAPPSLQKVTILTKAINRNKPFPSSGVLPSRQRFGGVSYIRGRCPRLLRVVPSKHQSADGV